MISARNVNDVSYYFYDRCDPKISVKIKRDKIQNKFYENISSDVNKLECYSNRNRDFENLVIVDNIMNWTFKKIY